MAATANATTTNIQDRINIKDPNLLEALQPGQLRVIKRTGTVVKFDQERIETAMKNAFYAVQGDSANAEHIIQTTKILTEQISQRLLHRWPTGGTIHIEEIQDQVELALMRQGEQKVARSYVLYREERRIKREAQQ